MLLVLHSQISLPPCRLCHPPRRCRRLQIVRTGGWGAPFLDRMCCGPTVDVTLQPCPMDSCPLHAGIAPFDLPGVPFLAEIAGGKCKCVAPQVCDA